MTCKFGGSTKIMFIFVGLRIVVAFWRSIVLLWVQNLLLYFCGSNVFVVFLVGKYV
jgi:hypothetical protein